MDFLNPSPVPLRLDTAAGAYTKLAELLREIGTQANDKGCAADLTADERAQWFAVRDAARRAATEALVPRGGTRTPRCRRCGVDCPECSPPDPAAEPGYVVDVNMIGYHHQRVAVPPGMHMSVSLLTVDLPGAIGRGEARELHGTVAVQPIAPPPRERRTPTVPDDALPDADERARQRGLGPGEPR